MIGGADSLLTVRWRLRYALREENLAAILGWALTLIAVGTLAYTLGEGWSFVDGFYFSVATLTTSDRRPRTRPHQFVVEGLHGLLHPCRDRHPGRGRATGSASR